MAVETIVPLLEMGASGEDVLGIIDAALKEVTTAGCTPRTVRVPWLDAQVQGASLFWSFPLKTAR